MSSYLIIAILWLAALKCRHRRRFSTVDVDKSNNIGLIRRRNLLKYKPLVEQGLQKGQKVKTYFKTA